MSFSGFANQQPSIELLQRSLDRGRLSHAYLFFGESIEELEPVARTLAKTVNCENPARVGATGLPMDSCDSCPSCRTIDGENHPDIYWIRPESKSRVITIDQMRDLMQLIHLKPTQAKRKVAVIVGADRLNVQAGNAFLKTLEEPPAGSLIVLLSTEPQRLLETILSRCLRLSFGSGSAAGANEERSQWVVSFSEVAAQANKGLLSRYRLLSILLSQLAQVKNDAETSMTARSPLERHADVETKLRDKWEDELAAAIESEYRRRRSDVLMALQWWLRDVWLQTLALGADLLTFPRLAKTSQAVAMRIGSDEAVDNLRVLERMQTLLGSNVQEALALEVGLLRLRL
jgi:DNA polymerase III subunit delta'